MLLICKGGDVMLRHRLVYHIYVDSALASVFNFILDEILIFQLLFKLHSIIVVLNQFFALVELSHVCGQFSLIVNSVKLSLKSAHSAVFHQNSVPIYDAHFEAVNDNKLIKCRWVVFFSVPQNFMQIR